MNGDLCAQENQGPASDRVLPARALADPAAAAAVLQDISPDRAAALDILIEEDVEALERLRLVRVPDHGSSNTLHEGAVWIGWSMSRGKCVRTACIKCCPHQGLQLHLMHSM